MRTLHLERSGCKIQRKLIQFFLLSHEIHGDYIKIEQSKEEKEQYVNLL